VEQPPAVLDKFVIYYKINYIGTFKFDMIKQNLDILLEKIEIASVKAGKQSGDIILIAVSKQHPEEEIREAVSLGLKHFGENRAREMQNKASIIKGGLYWHFIGNLQTNKVKYLIDSAEYIHSVESKTLADEIDKRASGCGKIQKVLLEFKTSYEESKAGLGNEDEVLEMAEYCSAKKNLSLEGLMTMAPYTDDEKVIRHCFRKTREMLEKLRTGGYPVKELSMGMSGDFEIAIEEGATMIRIGTALFGERIYTKKG